MSRKTEKKCLPISIMVDEDIIRRNPGIYDEFRRHVVQTLSDPRGWNKYGYFFREIDQKPGINPQKDRNIIHIRLSAGETVENECGFSGMSCCDMAKKNILINYTNWMTCGKSSLPRDRYRTYVINHEIGHALGLDHAVCSGPGRTGSVMMQMTRGPSHIYPCIENEWPLDPDYYDETTTMISKYGMGESRAKPESIFIILIILVVCLVLLLSFRMLYIRGTADDNHIR